MENYYLTDPGKLREQNEDSVIIVSNIDGEYLLAVADGMGGHSNGEVASSIAISHLGKSFKELKNLGDKESAANWIRTITDEINVLLCKYVNENPESNSMGTTLVLALLTKEYLLFANIGDSSGFVMKAGKLHKITKDHTLVNLLVESGELTEKEAKEHPRKNVLMKALGANITGEIDVFDVSIDIDAVFLCSDGLTNMLDNEQIEKVLNADMSAEEKMQKLIFKSNNRGGNDNISVAYLKR
jgi:protein phosphatase